MGGDPLPGEQGRLRRELPLGIQTFLADTRLSYYEISGHIGVDDPPAREDLKVKGEAAMTRSRLTAFALIAAAAAFAVGGAPSTAQAMHPVYVRSYYYDYCPPAYYYPAPVVYYRPAPVYYSYPVYPAYRYSRVHYYPRAGFGFSFYYGGHHHRYR